VAPAPPHWSEEVALRALLRRGFTELARNARYRIGEIDLVMEEAGTVVFVEVRQRSAPAAGSASGSAGESLHQRKLQRVRRAAALWLVQHRAEQRRVRFDAVLVEGTLPKPRVRLLRDAF